MSGFCTVCSWRVESFEGLNACPNCGSTSKPCGDADQVTISVNWHELRVLCIWAERWAIEKVEPSGDTGGGRGVVYAIADRIAAQNPGRGALTLARELNDMRDAGLDVRTNIPGEEGRGGVA